MQSRLVFSSDQMRVENMNNGNAPPYVSFYLKNIMISNIWPNLKNHQNP